ncbi:MAG: hypothetical protein O3A46_09120 [Candidatus Poribacteria bacterium]|nr:hypothetical protein [Candidatus Poribacteria bacterium]
MTIPTSVLLDGTDNPTPQRISLRAGALMMQFEPELAFLRYVRLGRTEILRGLYAAVRDHNWGTVAPRVTLTERDVRVDSFRLAFDVTCVQNDIDFLWRGTLTGDPDGAVTFTFNGEARSAFRRNRIGFCVLHPVEDLPGSPCRVEKTDGSLEEGVFPLHISPEQPFMDMRAISHEVAPGLRASVRMEGDTFEMEDQRNWTDASYKTYCTPLAVPYPVEVARGTRIRQRVTISFTGDFPESAQDEASSGVTVTLGDEIGALPGIGLGVASHGQPLSASEIRRLRALNLSHLRVDLNLEADDVGQTLSQAVEQSRQLDIPLEVALHLGEQPVLQLDDLVPLLDDAKPNVIRWIVFHRDDEVTDARWVRLARRFLDDYDTSIPVGAGANAYFTELNRDRPDPATLDFVCFSINPQVHAFDNASLSETLPMQAATVESARQFMGETPIVITPVTLKPRFNPNATGDDPQPLPDELPSQVDPRQMSLFGAAWTVGSLKRLLSSGIESVTYYETTGWRGVMETEDGSPIPTAFRSMPGGVYPLYHVFAEVAEVRDGAVLDTESSDALAVEALAVRRGDTTRLLVANLTPERQTVTVHGDGLGGQAYVLALDETSANRAMAAPEVFRTRQGAALSKSGDGFTLELLPYAVARMDISIMES